MRILVLAGLFLACFMYFRNSEEQRIAVELSSKPTKIFGQHKLTLKADIPRDEVTTTQAALRPIEEKVSSGASRELAIEDIQDVEQVEIAWEDVNSEWQTELKNYLYSVAPDKAEEIYEMYSRVGASYKETPEESKSDDAVAVHEEQLKSVFGQHYEAIKSLHQEYVDTIQDQAGIEAQLHIQL